MAKSETTLPCPCGLGQSLAACCGRYLSGAQSAPDAQALMRSRYCAYVLQDQGYLERTWHERTRPELDLAHQEPCKWLGLTIVRHEPQQQRALVEFIARYKIGGRAHRLHEISSFEFEDGQWFYVDGQFPEQNS